MIRKIIYSFFLLVMYYGVFFALKYIDILGSRFYSSGIPVIAYIIFKAIFACYFMIILLTAGTALQRIILPRSDISSVGSSTYFIACFFLGASTLALTMFILGFLKVYCFVTAIAITTPFVGLAPFMLPSVIRDIRTEVYEILKKLSPTVRLTYIMLLLSTIVVAFVLLLHKGIFPGEMDSDVWMHYLHYYKEVSANGGIWPNDLWYHFYLSKGAGLFFLAISLTDVMSPAIVSWCFVILTAIMTYALLNEHIDYPLWPLLGALLVLLAFSAITNQYVSDNTTSSFIKHHIVLMGFIVFAFWCTVRISSDLSNETVWLVGIAGASSFFYVGIYIPTATIPLIALWFFEVATLTLFLQKKLWRASVFVGFAVAALFGSILAFLINYSVTGLAEHAPASLMWKFANKEQFGRLWSPWIMEYFFLGSNADSMPISLINILRIDMNWIEQLCRVWFFKRVPLLSFLIILIAFIVAGGSLNSLRFGIYPTKKRQFFSLYIILFICTALIFAQLFKNQTSLFRLYNFIVVFIILLIIHLWALVTVAMRKYKQAILAGIVLLSATFFMKDLPRHITKNRMGILRQYITGQISIRDAMASTDSMIGSYVQGKTPFSLFIEAHRYIKDGSKILYIGQDSGPGYFFPDMIVSEPSYALGNKYNTALFGSPEEARSVYRQLGINYFALNLRRKFFCGIPFSPLFKIQNLPRYFEFVWSSGDFYLLTWRSENSDQIMPSKFLRDMERKQLEESREVWGIYYDEMSKKSNLVSSQ